MMTGSLARDRSTASSADDATRVPAVPAILLEGMFSGSCEAAASHLDATSGASRHKEGRAKFAHPIG